LQKKLLRTEKNMLKKGRAKPYENVSLIYPGLMKNVNFKSWADYVADIAERFLHGSISVLELASGSCIIAGRLKNKFKDFIATDISLPMLKSAEENNLKIICCSMIQLPFKHKFDFIFSTFDSINYLLTERELFHLFKEVKSLVKNDGIFTFDASLEANSLLFKNQQVTEGNYKNYNFKRSSIYSRSKRIHKNVFQIENTSGVKYKEIHRQKIYSFDTFFSLIDKAGLFVKECYDAFTFNTGSPDSERVQFVVGKKSV